MQHFLLLIVSVLILGAYPASTHAGAVWRIEISDYQEPPPVAEAGGVWSQLSRWLMGRTVARPPIGTTFTVNSSAYASSPYQTDSTPCITAAGTRVRPGTVATNFLPFGTIVEINDKPYIVEDRMNARYRGYYLDIWFPSTSEALEFGRRKLKIEVIGYGTPGQALKVVQAATTQETTETESIAEETMTPSLLERVNLRFLATSRRLSRFVATNVANRHDVDCFADVEAAVTK